jgi:uncharacterized membrane protein
MKKSVKEKPAEGGENKILFAFLATFLSIIGFVIVVIFKREDKYVTYYAKHSLIIFLIILLLGVVSNILFHLPIIGLIIYIAAYVMGFIIWMISWLNALSGKEKPIAIITEWADKIKL